jgi:transposase
MKNSKTDAVDANTLAEYAARMDFVAWTRPSDEKLALRSFARRIDALTRQKAAANDCMDAGGRAKQEQLPGTICMPCPPLRKRPKRC